MDLQKKKELIDIVKNKNLNDIQLYQIFCMVKEDTDKFTQNNNGIFVNIKRLKESTIEKIYKFVISIENEIDEDNETDTESEVSLQ
jgi:hypothetical protein